MNTQEEEDTTRDILGFINAIMLNDTILLRTSMINLDNTDTNEDTNEGTNEGTNEEFLNNMDEFVVDSEFIKKELQCSICLDDFKVGDKCIRLPCKGEPHVFHSGSDSCSGVSPWLSRNNTCPMCRHEFPKEISRAAPSDTTPVGELIYHNLHNPNSLENTITNLIQEYINGVTTEEEDLQRAIELSLND
jgi:hypothetical protein